MIMNPAESSEEKILFVRLSAIGDVVHTLPCVHILKESLPSVKIGWLVESTASFLVEMNPYVDYVHYYPRKELSKPGLKMIKFARNFLKNLNDVSYDTSIDFQGLTKSSIIPFLARISERIGFAGKDGRELSRLFNKNRIKQVREHVIMKNCALLEPLLNRTVTQEEVALPYVHLSEEKTRPVHEKFHEYLVPAPVIINPGGGWITKIWPLAYYRKLIRMLVEDGAHVCISWGPGEEEMARSIYHPFQGKKGVHILPKTSLFELAALLQKASLVIGPDTGPIHIAAGLDRPVVSIFGPSDNRRNAPWSSKAIALQEFFPCGPCWNKTTCKYELRCLAAIEPEKVHSAAMKLIVKT